MSKKIIRKISKIVFLMAFILGLHTLLSVCFEKDLVNTEVHAKSVKKSVSLQDGTYSGKMNVSYNDAWLNKKSTSYNKSMALFCSEASALMYNTNNNEIESLLKKAGYKNIIKSKDSSGEAISYVLTHKKIKSGKKKKDVLFVIFRGSDGKEWINNFEIGYKKNIHSGFKNASDMVYKKLNTYAKKYKVKNNSKIIITGHSRGGAVANLLGKKINDSGINKKKYNRTDIFVYTFASPATTKNTDKNNKKYKNIFNIVNENDLFTKLPPSSWGYGVYGNTHKLPKSPTDKMKKVFKSITNKDFEYNENSSVLLDEYVTFISSQILSNEEYYSKNLKTGMITTKDEEHSLKNLFQNAVQALYGDSTQKMAAYMLTISVGMGDWGEVGKKTMSLFMENGMVQTIATGHLSQTYVAYLS